ncbi:GntR family transcriptional regulator [Paenibacillus rhizovicinus]|uniref:GntR family transcriptional regulator n=1 Tax=Paenibacillus rhizovicinus TaxID=2704463 RepID=A0A6C0P3K7_9BACL|nr:GntR family transcriptional regulator [Paenibacillus rhizovicinus]QHW33088.1 GntR family transcriptional regulator [Paenibacillus rhizovicinus]
MDNFSFKEQKPTSLRHRITDDIRNAILNGQLKPGDKLRESAIAKEMGVSRGPIREAMRTLEQEGLLHSSPYKETVVAEFSQEEVIEVLIPIRLTIELFAIRSGLSQMTDADFAHMQTFVDGIREAVEREDPAGIVNNDIAFHEYIIQASRASNVMNIWSSIVNRIRLHFFIQNPMYSDPRQIYEEHDILLQAMRAKDIELACRLMKAHIHDENVALLQPALPDDK